MLEVLKGFLVCRQLSKNKTKPLDKLSGSNHWILMPNFRYQITMFIFYVNFKGSGWEYMVQIEALSSLSVRKVSLVKVKQQEEEHRVVHHVQVEHYQRHF